jgi:hypothetical protein
MVGHDTPTEYDQTFIYLTKPEAINNNVPVNNSGKHIRPTNYCEANKIDTFRVVKLIAPAHVWKICNF